MLANESVRKLNLQNLSYRGFYKKFYFEDCLLYGINGHNKISPYGFHQERIAGKIISIDIFIYFKYPGNVSIYQTSPVWIINNSALITSGSGTHVRN